MLLKLAIWKTKIKDQIGMLNDLLTTEKKMQCRIDSISIVKFIVPNALLFLLLRTHSIT